MSWKVAFDKGVACFKRGDLQQALVQMNQAAELDDSNFIIYDSRAAVHEKLGSIKAALLDSKRVIDLAPGQWQGYSRSARLFDLLGKHDPAIKMVNHALSRLRPDDIQKRTPLLELREKAVAARATAEKRRSSKVAQASYLLGTLPVETLVEIFTVLIIEDHTWSIKLSHVCGHWRRILINTPSAWRTLVLSGKNPLRKAKLWKERTKNHITRISVEISELDRASVFAQLQDLYWDNLSSLNISGNAFVKLHHMLTDISLPHAFSNLDELSLFDYKARDQLSCCLSGPKWKLRALRLTGVICMMNEWWLQIQQLKELHLYGVVTHFTPLVFEANPSLETLVLSFFDCIPSSDNSASPISMENLRTIDCQGVAYPSHVLHAIFAPSITHFRMFSATIVDEPLLRICSRPSLVELQIGHCSLSSSTLPTLLSSTPNLKMLKINSIQSVVNEMFQFLAPNTANSLQGLPCRALQHVDVSHCSDLTTSSVYAFVKTRTRYADESVGSMERCAVVELLKVDGCPNIEPGLLPWFRSKVGQFSCVYATRKDFVKNRGQRQ